MKLTCISDTHQGHEQLKLGSGEVLVFCGDMSQQGTEEELEEFFAWFARQDYEHKVCIAGNHDMGLEETPHLLKKHIPKGVHYLCHSGCTLGAYYFWGSPVSPYQNGLAFNLHDADMANYWKKIPSKTQILLTHTPPLGILDDGRGCPYLAKELPRLKKLRLHVFGHIHQGYGSQVMGNCSYINAAMCVGNPHQNPDNSVRLRQEIITIEI